MLIIGDVHGKVNEYWKILSRLKGGKSLQLGDFGFKKEHLWHTANIDATKHKVLFGNHDDTTFLNAPHSKGNWSFENGIFTVRGAKSIDAHLRTEGKDWWSNEELTHQELQEVVDAYERIKPLVVVTHDCPNKIREHFFSCEDKTITTNALEIMRQIHSPKIWLFGHWHRSRNEEYNNTRFICLAELETFMLEDREL